jgi:hypothetical protein
MNGAFISVIDSYISDCKEDGADSQALLAYSTVGPLKIVNNYLEGAGENVLFGGADPSIPNAVPSDIEIRCNLFFKPLNWMNELWDVKNLLEFKNAQRVLVEGNRFENCWPNAQNGFALLFTPRNQNNTAPWSVVQDITVRFNTWLNIAQGVNISGYDSPNVSQRTARLLIQNNEWHIVNLGTGGDGRMFQVLNGAIDLIFDHNTGFCWNAYLMADGSPKTDSFVFQNNLVNYGNYGFIGSGTAYANTTLAAFFNPNWTVTKNAVIGGSTTGYPPGNYFPANTAAVAFVDAAGGNYRLAASSPYKYLGTDGKDLGADIDSIAIAGIYGCDISTGTTGMGVQPLAVTLYPVPADGILHIQTGLAAEQTVQISIYNLVGQVMSSKTSIPGDLEVCTTTLREGIYVLKIGSKGQLCFKKFIVQH